MLNIDSLNPQQREAVIHRDGPALVLAGAGSGKTRVITTRIAYLIEQGVSPSNILGVTFTNKAAKEMRERVATLLDPKQARRVHLSTFHALGAQILREDIDRLGYTKPFLIVDESDRFRIIKNALKELNLAGTSSNEARLLSIISKAKNAMTTPAKLPEARYNPEMPRAQRVFEIYDAALRNLNAVDFDDLLLLPTRLLADNGDLRHKYRSRFLYVMVDEYQDTNPIQLRMLQELVGPPAYNLMVVGDDDQSIYAFRGAVSEYILRFEEFFANTKVVALEQNYRSVGTVLRAANAVIANNSARRKKTLWSTLGDGHPIEYIEYSTNVAEAEHIARRIRSLSVDESRPMSHFSILYRGNAQARILEEELRRQHIPYRVVGGRSVFDNKEVKDLLAYLQWLQIPTQDLSLRRILNYPTRGIGTTSAEAIIKRAREYDVPLVKVMREQLEDPIVSNRALDGIRSLLDSFDRARRRIRQLEGEHLPRIIYEFVKEIGLKQAISSEDRSEGKKVARVRWKIVEEMIASLARAEGDSARQKLESFVATVSLDRDFGGDEEDEDTNRVTLMTLHSSKGLEFPVVFMCGMNEKVLPHERALLESGGVAEERRLCYVGMTRAKQRLLLTRFRYRMSGNERIKYKPSRFLDEIPPDLMVRHQLDTSPRDPEKQAELNARGFAHAMAILNGEAE